MRTPPSLSTIKTFLARQWCGWLSSNPIAQYYSIADYSKLFDPTTFLSAYDPLPKFAYRSDGVVPLTSALNSNATFGYDEIDYQISSPFPSTLASDNGGLIFNKVIHGKGTEDLGFPGPFLLEQQTGIPDAAENLLNTPVTNGKVYHRNYGRFQ